MIRTKPITIPMPATIPTRISCPSTGVTARSSCPALCVAPAVLNVGDELDDHAGEQRGRDQADQQREQREPGRRGDEQRREDPGDHEHDGRGGHQHGGLVDVDVEHPADHRADVKRRFICVPRVDRGRR